MVLINEIGDYEDIKSALRGALPAPPTWKVRPEWRNRVISAYAIERAHWLEIERLIGRAEDATVRNMLARIYLEEEAHQAVFSSLLGPAAVPWQPLIASELAFISLTTLLAQIEPDKHVKAVFDYLIIDHLTHVKALVDETKGLGIDQEMVEEADRLPAGREFSGQFWPTQDLISEPYRQTADPATKVSVRLVLMAETAVRELVETLGAIGSPESLILLGRRISTVESEHNLLLRTLLDPHESPLEQAFYSELAEVIGLNRLLATEKESGAKDAYEFVGEEDEDHLRYLGALMIEVEGRDPSVLSESPVFSAKPRRTLQNYLPEIIKTGLNVRPSGRPVTKVA